MIFCLETAGMAAYLLIMTIAYCSKVIYFKQITHTHKMCKPPCHLHIWIWIWFGAAEEAVEAGAEDGTVEAEILDLLEAEAGRTDLVCSQLFSLNAPRKNTLCRAMAVSGTSVVNPDPHGSASFW